MQVAPEDVRAHGDENQADEEVRAEIIEATVTTIDEAVAHSAQTGEPMSAGVADPSMDGVDVTAAEVRARMDLLSQNQSHQKEYRLKLLHRMMMRQLPTDMIAKSLGVTVRTVNNLKRELSEQLRKEAMNRDLGSYVGFTDGFYNEMIGMSMRMATSKDTPDIRKLSAMKVALQAQRDRTAFYETAGFFSALKVLPGVDQDDERTRQANSLMDMSNKVLELFDMDEAEYEERMSRPPEPHEVFKSKDDDEDDEAIRIL